MNEAEKYAAWHVRRAWLRWYTHMTDYEIEFDLAVNPPSSLEEELDQLIAVRDLHAKDK